MQPPNTMSDRYNMTDSYWMLLLIGLLLLAMHVVRRVVHKQPRTSRRLRRQPAISRLAEVRSLRAFQGDRSYYQFLEPSSSMQSLYKLPAEQLFQGLQVRLGFGCSPAAVRQALPNTRNGLIECRCTASMVQKSRNGTVACYTGSLHLQRYLEAPHDIERVAGSRV